MRACCPVGPGSMAHCHGLFRLRCWARVPPMRGAMQCKERLYSTRCPRGESPVTCGMWRNGGRGGDGCGPGRDGSPGGSCCPSSPRPARAARRPAHAAAPSSTPNSPLFATLPPRRRLPKKSPGVFVVENRAENAVGNVGRYSRRPAVSFFPKGCGKQCSYTINGFLRARKHNI